MNRFTIPRLFTLVFVCLLSSFFSQSAQAQHSHCYFGRPIQGWYWSCRAAILEASGVVVLTGDNIIDGTKSIPLVERPVKCVFHCDDGIVTNLSVLKSSGFRSIDEIALNLIRKAKFSKPFESAPQGYLVAEFGTKCAADLSVYPENAKTRPRYTRYQKQSQQVN